MRHKIEEAASAPAPGGVEDNFHPSSSAFGEYRETDIPAVDGSDLRRCGGDPRSVHPNGQRSKNNGNFILRLRAKI
jgi:hypothetical protein